MYLISLDLIQYSQTNPARNATTAAYTRSSTASLFMMPRM